MKIAIIGYGKMGKMIERSAQAKGHEIVAIVDPNFFGNAITEDSLKDAEVCIEFTTPANVVENIKQVISLKRNIVVGTTGWGEHLEEVKSIVENEQAGLFFTSNFSIGMNLFIKILQEAAKNIIPTGGYDIAGIESHHNQKLDIPSGSAKAISEAIAKSVDCEIEVPFSSVRCGSMPGTHTIMFDSPVDTITLSHAARNREGFAEGAIAAAEWVKGKKGIFTMNDLLFSGEKKCKV